jgi:hypothetical protein
VVPAERRRSRRAVSPHGARLRASIPRRYGTRLVRSARGVEQRQLRSVDRRQGDDRGDGVLRAPRHPVFLCARRRIHDLRRLLLLADGPDRSQPLPHVDRLGRQRRQGRRSGGGPAINNAEAGYDWSTYPERLERAGIGGRSIRTAASGWTRPASGALPTTPISATTATTRCCTSTSTRTPSPASRCTRRRGRERTSA